MNLYQIDVEHAGPKDCLNAIAGYVIAKNEEKLYDYLASCDSRYQGLGISTGWSYKYVEGADDNEIYESSYTDKNDEEIVISENWKEKMIRIGGELGDEDRDYDDAYYGITYYGWTDLGPIPEMEMEVMKFFLGKALIILE